MPDTLPIDSIFFRQVTAGDFWNVERDPAGAGPVGGGGQQYFDIPIGGGLQLPELWSFLGVGPGNPNNSATWPEKTINASVLGAPGIEGPVPFERRGQVNARYRIARQNRTVVGGERHPAWSPAHGFPSMPAGATGPNDPAVPDVSNLRIFVVKTVGDLYFAGFVDSVAMPAAWPAGFGLEAIFTGAADGLLRPPAGAELPPLALRILDAWTRRPNVLVYGPPGTGKTHAMEALRRAIESGKPLRGLRLDPTRADRPFVAVDASFPMPMPARVDWLTFHQNYSYEDFILGLRPKPTPAGLTLVARAGVLLDSAIEVSSGGTPKSAVLLIDEINRGNVSRVFGEFITFMDSSYRATLDGKANPAAIPVPFPQLGIDGTGASLKTEPIYLLNGSTTQLAKPWFFPEHVMTVGSMNSVDRAVAPLDTALARRFARVEARPDLSALAVRFGSSSTEIDDRVRTGVQLSAADLAWLMLRRLNYELATLLGNDFEVGHLYMWPVSTPAAEADRLMALCTIWDQDLVPQLRDRFASRPTDLARVVRLPDELRAAQFLVRYRQPPLSAPAEVRSAAIDFEPLAARLPSGEADVRYTLKRLAGL